MRLMHDVVLEPGDVVVWGCATNDAMCLSTGFFHEDQLLAFIEEMIIHCGATGARFVPVVIDTAQQHLAAQQVGYLQKLLEMLAYYGLKYLDLTKEYCQETGESFVPDHQYSDGLHFYPNSDMTNFIADLSAKLIASGAGHVQDRPALICDPNAQYELISDFSDSCTPELFENKLVRTTVWQPPLAVPPRASEAGRAEIVALGILADPTAGAFTLTSGGQSCTFSVSHFFPMDGKPIFLTLHVRNIAPDGIFVSPGDQITLEPSDARGHVGGDIYTRQRLMRPMTHPNKARLERMLLRRV